MDPLKPKEKYSAAFLRAACVANGGCRIPGNGHHLAVALLCPDGIASAEMKDGLEGDTAVQPVEQLVMACIKKDRCSCKVVPELGRMLAAWKIREAEQACRRRPNSE